MNSLSVSDQQRIEAMQAGGEVLHSIKRELRLYVQTGMKFSAIEKEAQRLIKQAGMKPSFSTVPGYDWATCIMRNQELCHGIPSSQKQVIKGDLLTIDVGVINQGFHVDTTTSFVVDDADAEKESFLQVGQKSLTKAIAKVKPGTSVYELSKAMQKVVEQAGYSAVFQLTGHGVGAELHMEPAIPCITQRSDKKVKLRYGQTIAVEIMYAKGDAHLSLDSDGWTYSTSDGSLSAMFEETVLVTEKGSQVLT